MAKFFGKGAGEVIRITETNIISNLRDIKIGGLKKFYGFLKADIANMRRTRKNAWEMSSPSAFAIKN